MPAEWLNDAVIVSLWPAGIDFRKDKIDIHKLIAKFADVGINTLRLDYYDLMNRCYYNSRLVSKEPELGARDLFRETIEPARKYGIKVLAATHAGCIGERLYKDHLDWVALDENGNYILPGWGPHKHYFSCPNSGYREFMGEIAKEMVEKYKPDGFYLDGPHLWKICHCKTCATLFKKDKGFDLPGKWPPQEKDFENPAWLAYLDWKYKVTEQFLEYIVRSVKEVRKDIPCIYNQFTFEQKFCRRSARIPELLTKYVDGVLVEGATTTNGFAISTVGERVKFIRSFGVVPIAYVETCVYGWPVPSNPASDMKVKIGEIISGGGRPIFWPGFYLYRDVSGIDGTKELLRSLRSKRDFLKGCDPVKYAALIYSRRTAELYGRDKVSRRYERSYKGLYKILTHLQIPFDVISEEQIEERITKYKMVVLSNLACLNDNENEIIKKFVKNGGNLIATYETSLFDERGTQRNDFGLGDVFRVRYQQASKTSPALLEEDADLVRVDKPDGRYNDERMPGNVFLEIPQNSPFSRGMDMKPLNKSLGILVPADRYTAIKTKLPVVGFFHSYAGDKIQRGVIVGPSTKDPGIVISKFGRGKVAYLAFDLGYTYFTRAFPILRRLFLNIINRISKPPIIVQSPGCLKIELWRGKNKGVMHLVNYSSGSEYKEYPIDYIPGLRGISVKIKLFHKEKPVNLKIYPGGKNIKYKIEKGYLKFTLDEIQEYNFLCFEFNSQKGSSDEKC